MSKYSAEYWDHRRDHEKHEPRPGDRDFPARFDKPLTTAMDIVVLVKAMPNYTDAASLIEQYAKMVAAGVRVEEARLSADRLDRIAAGIGR